MNSSSVNVYRSSVYEKRWTINDSQSCPPMEAQWQPASIELNLFVEFYVLTDTKELPPPTNAFGHPTFSSFTAINISSLSTVIRKFPPGYIIPHFLSLRNKKNSGIRPKAINLYYI